MKFYVFKKCFKIKLSVFGKLFEIKFYLYKKVFQIKFSVYRKLFQKNFFYTDNFSITVFYVQKAAQNKVIFKSQV